MTDDLTPAVPTPPAIDAPVQSQPHPQADAVEDLSGPDPHLPQLDHDADGRPGGAKKAPAQVWIVTRADGLIRVPAARAKALREAGARDATPRDFRVAGVDPAA